MVTNKREFKFNFQLSCLRSSSTFGSYIGFLSRHESSTNCVSSCTRPWLVRRRTTSPTCSHRSPTQQRRLPTKNRAANWWLCILSLHLVYGITDRTETHAVVDSNIQAPSEVFFFARRTDYVMHLQADCRRRTTNSAVTVTVSSSTLKSPWKLKSRFKVILVVQEWVLWKVRWLQECLSAFHGEYRSK